MDYIPLQPGPRRIPRDLVLITMLEVLLAFAAAWVAITRVPSSEIMDHREFIATAVGNTLPLALLACPLVAWIAFHRRADGAIWPILWSPALLALIVIVGFA